MKKDDLTERADGPSFSQTCNSSSSWNALCYIYIMLLMFILQVDLSTDAQAGLAIGYQAFFILMALGFGLSSALSALVSNAKGSGETSCPRSENIYLKV